MSCGSWGELQTQGGKILKRDRDAELMRHAEAKKWDHKRRNLVKCVLKAFFCLRTQKRTPSTTRLFHFVRHAPRWVCTRARERVALSGAVHTRDRRRARRLQRRALRDARGGHARSHRRARLWRKTRGKLWLPRALVPPVRWYGAVQVAVGHERTHT